MMIKIFLLLLLFFFVPFVYGQRATQQGGADSTTESLWHLNEGDTEATAYDNATNNNGTFSGTTLLENCLWGACRSFGGDPDNIVVDAGWVSNQGAFTISLWVNGADQADLRIYSETNTNAAPNKDWFSIDCEHGGGGHITLYAREDNIAIMTLTGTIIALDNTWHYVTVICDGTTVSLYVDGVFDNSAVPTDALSDNVYAYATIGSYNLAGTPGGFFVGNIEEVRTELRMLTPAEIRHRYTSRAKAYQ